METISGEAENLQQINKSAPAVREFGDKLFDSLNIPILTSSDCVRTDGSSNENFAGIS